MNDDLLAAAVVRVYVNEHGVSVPRGTTAADAVDLMSAELGADVRAGRARLTDSRGLPIPHTTLVHGGLILRVLPVRESTRALDAGGQEEHA